MRWKRHFLNSCQRANAVPARIQEVCARNKDFYYISFVKNAGLSAAIKAGFDYTCSEFVGYMDADLQTTPEDFNLLLDGMEGKSMMIGIRANRKDTFFKKIQSKIANGFRKMMTHDGATDTGCPLKTLPSVSPCSRVCTGSFPHSFFFRKAVHTDRFL